jgi:hypothetical protein
MFSPNDEQNPQPMNKKRAPEDAVEQAEPPKMAKSWFFTKLEWKELIEPLLPKNERGEPYLPEPCSTGGVELPDTIEPVRRTAPMCSTEPDQ